MKPRIASALVLISALLAGAWQGFQFEFLEQINNPGSALPQASSIVFQHNIYDGDTTPQVGSVAFTRSGAIHYASSNSVVSSAATNALQMPAFRLGGAETLGGLAINGRAVNSLLRSEEFENAAWTAVGGGSATAGTADSPLSGADTLGDTISGAAPGDGIQQSFAVTAANRRMYFAVWLWVTSATREIEIRIADNTASEIGFAKCPLTTSNTFRCEVAKKFSASASGNVKVQILVGNSSDVRAWGAQSAEFALSPTGPVRTAQPYVKTTTAAVTTERDEYVVPNAIIAQAATKGSIAFWMSASRDPNDYGVQGSFYPFRVKVTDSELALFMNSNEQIGLYINNSVAVTSGYFKTWQRDYWDHYVVTWNTTTDVYKIYQNGSEIGTGSTSLSAAAVGSTDLKFGGWETSGYSLDGRISQIIIWKTNISASEAAAVYATKSADYAPPAYGTGKIFSVSLGTSMVPTVGPKRFWYEAPSSTPYYSSTTAYAVAAQGSIPAPAFALNGFNKGGMSFHSRFLNRILQSEAPGTTWTAVVSGGAPTITNGVGTFLGTIAYGTIDGGAGDGIQQTIAGPIAAASRDYSVSVYASVAASTLDFQLCIEGDSGGTPETSCATKTATTTPQPFDHYKLFTSAATGNARMRLVLSATGVLRVGGMQMQGLDGNDQDDPSWKNGVLYTKTTTAAAKYSYNYLVYPNERAFNPNKGTLIVWAAPFFKSDDCIAPTGPCFLCSTGNLYEFYPDIGGTSDMKLSYGIVGGSPVLSTVISINRGTWYHWVYTWDSTVSPAQFKSYQNAVLIESDTATVSSLSPKNFMIGNMAQPASQSPQDKFPGGVDTWYGVIDKVDVYGDVLDASAVDADCEATKATYGVSVCGP